MPCTISRHTAAWLALVLLAGGFTSLRADVLVREKTISTGYMGSGGGETLSTIIVSGTMRRIESSTTPAQEPIREPQQTPSVDIIRLDRQLMWRLKPESKRYFEIPLGEIQRSAMLTAEGIAAALGPETDDEPMELTFDFRLDVENPGDTAPINDFRTDRTIVRLVGMPRDPGMRGELGEITITVDLWIAPEVPGQEELRSFERAYVEVVGVDPSLMPAGSETPGPFQGGLAIITQKVVHLDGYPIRSILTIESSLNRQEPGDPGRTVTSRAAGDRFLSNFAGKHFVKKQSADLSTPAESRSTPLLRVTREVLAIQLSDLNPGTFEVPADFQKVE